MPIKITVHILVHGSGGYSLITANQSYKVKIAGKKTVDYTGTKVHGYVCT